MIRKVFSFLLLIIGCSSDGPKKEQTIKIGGLAPLTGVDAAWGEVVATTFKYAEDEINSEGGVLGNLLEVILCDYGESPDGVKRCLQQFISKGIKIVIGPDSSEALLSGVCMWDEQPKLAEEKKCPFVSENKILIMATWPTSPIISDIEDGGFIFRICPSDEFQAKVLANHILSQGITRISVIYRDDWDGREFSKIFIDEITKKGEILSVVPYSPDKTKNFKEEVNKLYEKGNPDGIFLYTFNEDGVNLLVDLRSFLQENRKNRPKLFGCDCNQYPEISGGPAAADLVKDNMEGTTISPPHGDPDYESFKKRLIDKFGDEGAVDYLTYDAVYVVATSIELAGSLDPDKVKEKIIDATNEGDIVKPSSASGGSWAKIKEKIKAGANIDYKGVSGDVDFLPKGEIGSSTYIIWEIADNKGEWSDFKELRTVRIKDGRIIE